MTRNPARAPDLQLRLIPSSDFFADVRSILPDARRAAYTAVNSAMVEAYCQIGRRIVEEARYIFQKEERPPLNGEGVVTAYRDGQVTLRSLRRAESAGRVTPARS